MYNGTSMDIEKSICFKRQHQLCIGPIEEDDTKTIGHPQLSPSVKETL